MYVRLEIFKTQLDSWDVDENVYFVEGNEYKFSTINNGELSEHTLTFLGDSRIDGSPIFKSHMNCVHPLVGLSYETLVINEVTILGDHQLSVNLTKYRNLKQNKEIILEFLMKHHNIDDEYLLDDDSTKRVIREIRMGKILDS